MSNLVGQFYCDDAGNMSGRFFGVQSIIRQKYPKECLYMFALLID